MNLDDEESPRIFASLRMTLHPVIARHDSAEGTSLPLCHCEEPRFIGTTKQSRGGAMRLPRFARNDKMRLSLL